MESGVTNQFTAAVEDTQNVMNTDSTETFQSYIYELIVKNGILNDLRAYLRGHLVNVLKNAQTGDPPACQKNFKQRLELTSQAINILIAEYLLRLEFNYSFSVFMSEIPLANMVFGFAKSLLDRSDDDHSDIRFKDGDVWSILNYLGVQCDSEQASNIAEMYKNDGQTPLLLCILKCMSTYKEGVRSGQVSSEESLLSPKSLDSMDNKNTNSKNMCLTEKCKHYIFCKTCQNRIYRLKDKYKNKKKYLAENVKDSPNINASNTENLVKNISVMEKSLIDEMLQQLKSVYEMEVQMVKVEEEKKVKRSIASQAMKLQKKRDELEQTFKAREEELKNDVQQKKQFLWGLARALRDQHQNMSRAMHNVRVETQRLCVKEDSLKSQLAEAEQILKKRGEEMRLQISDELSILEGHLESMKIERDNITRERSALENMKETSSKLKVHNNDDITTIHTHYDLLKNELAILKKYIESSKLTPKCVIERGTSTEPVEMISKCSLALNNGQCIGKCSKRDDLDDRVKTNQVINDFKKMNINFSQSKLDEIYHERSRDPSRSSGSSEAGDTAAVSLELERGRDSALIHRLREENEQLKTFARQQCSHIEHLSSSVTPQYHARPRTAPARLAPSAQNRFNVNMSASADTVNVGWRKGAGEELSVFSNAQPRILVPGDTLPFIGVLRDRHGNARRPLLGQGRAGRSRTGPLAGVSKRPTSPIRERLSIGAGTSGLRLSGARLPHALCSIQANSSTYQSISDRLQQRTRPALTLEMNRNRSKSPMSMLKEAKKRLRNKDTVKGSPPAARDKSPKSILREAKMRLRKLEIEAEAVEKSYLDFRRKHSQLRLERNARARLDEEKELTTTLDVKRSRTLHKLDETTNNDIQAQLADVENTAQSDFDKYLREYKKTFDIGETHIRNKHITSETVKPIREPSSSIIEESDHIDTHDNYIETPLTEFRKLYTSARQTRRDDSEIKLSPKSINSSNTCGSEERNFEYKSTARHDSLRKVKHNKRAELEILKQNISKMYNLSNNNISTNSETMLDYQLSNCHKLTKATDENVLRVEMESISEINEIKSKKEEMLVVVQSSMIAREVVLTGTDTPDDMISAQMTIIVSPKCGPTSVEDGTTSINSTDRPKRSESPEQAAHLTRNDVLDAIFHADPNDQISSVQMQQELSKEVLDDSISEYEKGEYLDDFSADVDNSRSEDENITPISLPKTSEDDQFWDL